MFDQTVYMLVPETNSDYLAFQPDFHFSRIIPLSDWFEIIVRTLTNQVYEPLRGNLRYVWNILIYIYIYMGYMVWYGSIWKIHLYIVYMG